MKLLLVIYEDIMSSKLSTCNIPNILQYKNIVAYGAECCVRDMAILEPVWASWRSEKVLVFYIPIPGYAEGDTCIQKYSYEPPVEILSRCVWDNHLGHFHLSMLEDYSAFISSTMDKPFRHINTRHLSLYK